MNLWSIILLANGEEKHQSFVTILMIFVIQLSTFLVLSLLISRISMILERINWKNMEFEKKLESLQNRVTILGLPLSLKRRVIQMQRIVSKHQDEILNIDDFKMLNQNLQNDIVLYVNRNMISNVTCLHVLERDEMISLLNVFQKHFFLPNEIIIQEGDIGRSVLFVEKGTIKVYNNHFTKNIVAPKLFGEFCLLENTKRNASVLSVTFTSTNIISKNDFQSITDKYAGMNRRIMNNINYSQVQDEKIYRAIKDFVLFSV